MTFFRTNANSSALMFLLLMVHLFVFNHVQAGPGATASIQASAPCIGSLAVADSDGQTGGGDFKPPKHSFIDYSVFFASTYHTFAYHPEMLPLRTHETFVALPQVFLEITVPPDNPA